MLRYSVNQLSTLTWPFDKDIEHYAQIGVPAITPQRSKLDPYGVDAGIKLLEGCGMDIAALQAGTNFSLHDQSRWPAQIDAFKGSLEIAARLGVDLMIFQTGPGAGLSYEEAEARFVSILEQVLPEAERLGVRLSIEHNSALRVDLGFLGSFHNALDLADMMDSPFVTICLEINNAWAERHLYRNIKERTRRIGVVQIDDFKEGTTITPSRVPLGDGIIPIKRIIGALAEAGYDGYYDVELIGPHIEEMGYEEALRRCQVYLAHWD